MFDVTRLTITRQRRVSQALEELTKDHKAVKGLHPELRAAVGAAAKEGARLDVGPALSPLLVDNATDVVFGAFESWLGEIKRGMSDRLVAPLPPAQAAKRAAATTLLAKLYEPRAGFLQLDMSLQYKAISDVVRALRDDPECAAAVKELGAGYWVEHMEAHLAPYGHSVKTQDGRDLEAAGAAFHAALRQVVLKVLNHHDGDEAVRATVLGSYERELDAQREDERAARKRRKQKKSDAAKNG